MKKSIVLILVVFAMLSAKAQYVSLTNAEVKTLQKAIKDDERVKKLLNHLKLLPKKP